VRGEAKAKASRASVLIMSAGAHVTPEMPTKRVAAVCGLTDEAGRPLVLDPPYKTTWDIPGGIVEADESPRRAAQREVIGLDIETGELLVVDWKPKDGDFTEAVALLFDGGTLTARDIERIVVDLGDPCTYRFVELDEAATLLDAGCSHASRLEWQHADGQDCVLENGVPAPDEQLSP
jgi:ADP-ribose pyrophosphatase YjhB (NUDIX family)